MEEAYGTSTVQVKKEKLFKKNKYKKYKRYFTISIIVIVILILVIGIYLFAIPTFQNYVFGREQQAQQELIDYMLNLIERDGHVSITSGDRSYTLVPVT